MGDTFNEAQIAELREAFMRFDQNGDGSISTAELRVMMNELGEHPSEIELKQMIEEVDINGSGSIEFPEFLVMFMRRIKDTSIVKEIEDAFRLFDKDNSGAIDVKEMKDAMLKFGNVLSPKEVDDMFDEADSEGTGTFSFTDFVKNMMGQ